MIPYIIDPLWIHCRLFLWTCIQVDSWTRGLDNYRLRVNEYSTESHPIIGWTFRGITTGLYLPLQLHQMESLVGTYAQFSFPLYNFARFRNLGPQLSNCSSISTSGSPLDDRDERLPDLDIPSPSLLYRRSSSNPMGSPSPALSLSTRNMGMSPEITKRKCTLQSS